MTPPHGIPLDDTGEREAAGEEYVTKDAMKVRILLHEADCHEKGPLRDLREKVDKLRMQQAAGGGALALLTILGPVVLAWWLSTRLPSPQPQRSSATTTLINQAQAATKGNP